MPMTPSQKKRLLNLKLIDPERVSDEALLITELYLKGQLRLLEDEAVKRVGGLTVDLYQAIAALIAALAAQYDLREIDRGNATINWRNALRSALPALIAAFAANVSSLLVQASGAALIGMYYGKAWQLVTTTPPYTPVRYDPLNPSDYLRQMATEWRELTDIELDSLFTQIMSLTYSATYGKTTIADLLKQVGRVMGVKSVMGHYLSMAKGVLARLEGLARTLINRMGNEAARRLYRQNSDFVLEYEWLTANDERVCSSCAEMDGRIFTIGAATHPPLHFRCRCTIIPRYSPTLVNSSRPLEGLVTFAEWVATKGIGVLVRPFLSPEDTQ